MLAPRAVLLAIAIGALQLSLTPTDAVASEPTDTELKQAMRLPETIASSAAVLEDAELPRQLYSLCRENGLGDGATAAIVDQLGWAVAEGQEREAAYSALEALVRSGKTGRELLEELAAHEQFQGPTILEENHFTGER